MKSDFELRDDRAEPAATFPLGTQTVELARAEIWMSWLFVVS
jgi:hypothetical protein